MPDNNKLDPKKGIQMPKAKIILGNKNYSSWSLRVWIVLRKLEIDVKEISISLFTEGFRERLIEYSPAGKVPIFIEDDIKIWDSLAICEFLADTYLMLWPEDRKLKAFARSISAEMHSGFFAIRSAMPMNCRALSRKVKLDMVTQKEINRIQDIWTECRKLCSSKGKWLFGSFTIADAMFIPVVSRFKTYGIECNSDAEEYMTFVLNDPDIKEWYNDSKKEKEIIDSSEVGIV
jgi:glutathione S-transferase